MSFLDYAEVIRFYNKYFLKLKETLMKAILKDNAPKAREYRGHFSIQTLNSNNEVLDSYEDNNLIVNDARLIMARLLAGKKDSLGITEFCLGTRGHDEVNNDILTPKPIGQDGYDENREMLFSEEQKTPFYYSVKWNPTNLRDGVNLPVSFDLDEVEFVAVGNKKDQIGQEQDAENAQIPMKITISGNAVTFEITIPETAANGMNGQSVVAYTEAGLKCDGKLFSIKCFSSKNKEESVKFKITWRIYF